ncbi:hypothetical protein [Marinitoga sp. 38H-ov]|uniref:hypothetical protein n=1 Tax=Marinitoga sp. 38H-ov TaxID=1755814 RepID=UPI0013ED7B7E|nr:hypothetical protein [Marinitoga sp. 38H-ov]KAF2955286.1 hypothetical protein AS160_10865 [Marinitoga sp. 38H-ov]
MKHYSLNKLIDIIEYGAFSKPIVNYILTNIEDEDLVYYLLCLKSIWKNKHREAFKYADLVTTTTTTILNELATLEKISILFNNNKIKKANIELSKIKNNIQSLNKKARKIIIPALRFMEIRFSNLIDENLVRYWSEEYESSYAQKSLLKYSEARKYLNNKDFHKAFNLFIEGFNFAKRFPHPTMICSGLNNAAWWIREVDKKKALIAADLLEYYIGYYFEDLKYIYNWLDTIFEVKKINNDVRIIEITNIVNKLKKVYPEVNIEDNFDKFIEVKKLKRKIKKLYKINIDKFDVSKIDIAFLSTYASLIEKPYFTKSRILKLVFEKDKDKIIKYFSSNYEKMYFFNLMLSEFEVKEIEKRIMNPDDFEKIKTDVSPFFISRKKLIFNLLKNMKNFKEFILNYLELNEEEMRTFDMFLRNCVRYDIKWPITPYPKGKVRDFAIKYGLGQKRIALGYYSFEENERLFLDSIIEKFL